MSRARYFAECLKRTFALSMLMDRLADRDFHHDSKRDIDRLYAFCLGSFATEHTFLIDLATTERASDSMFLAQLLIILRNLGAILGRYLK